ncbi:uncharacterized protein LOC129914574 [Episyrphus balteatus]|uniref:uncharacterized protein LOC129914574 n=1 Tax=Episyrphus balteatus TaxID=286459 RepID=UPI0024855158|nr:uncharacterized protein LOC129914574 [Episyrphus balteatus]
MHSPSIANPKEIKHTFLKNNPKYKEIDEEKPALGDFFSIDEDEDEIWVMQCPKGESISFLKDQQIKLPGRSNHNNFETVATEYSEPILHAFGHKSKKGHNAVKILPVKGSIIMRSRLKAMPPPESSPPEASPVKVPMPKGIKERHPLHGVDFDKKLKIPSQIAKRLKEFYDLPTETLKAKKNKSKNKEGFTTIAMDSDGEVELVLQKKQKKKKRKHSRGDEDNEVSLKKKSKKHSEIENVAEDLQWIQTL